MAGSMKNDPVLERLDSILKLAQDVAILQAARAGMTRDGIRKIVPVSNNRISEIVSSLPRQRREGSE
jgi:hypothetical protein